MKYFPKRTTTTTTTTTTTRRTSATTAKTTTKKTVTTTTTTTTTVNKTLLEGYNGDGKWAFASWQVIDDNHQGCSWPMGADCCAPIVFCMQLEPGIQMTLLCLPWYRPLFHFYTDQQVKNVLYSDGSLVGCLKLSIRQAAKTFVVH